MNGYTFLIGLGEMYVAAPVLATPGRFFIYQKNSLALDGDSEKFPPETGCNV